MGRPRFIIWPGWPFLRFACLLSTLNALWFWIVYDGCEWITSHRSLRVPIAMPWELKNIPFVPGAVVIYMSIYLLFLVGPFMVRERREFATLISSLALATLLGGIGFLLFPSRAAFPPPGDLGVWAGLFHFADWLNRDYNMVPSLHVALSVCCIAAFAKKAAPPGRALLWTWAAVIALSTLLTHQHHVVDVVAGWCVGLCAHRAAWAMTLKVGQFPKPRRTEPRDLRLRR